MPSIPLIDLRAQYAAIKPEIDRAIQAVFDRGQFILGPEVEAFEREMASYCGTSCAVAVASGTDALALALLACGVGPGDEVITTAFSFVAAAEAIIRVGASPVFVDIEPQTYTLDPAHLAAALSPRTKAIIPVHLYGHPCDMDPIVAFTKAHGLTLIEDCAQALGATYRGKPVGSFGDAGCLSFYPSKTLGGYGDGGMVVTDDREVARRLRLLRTHGSEERYHHLILGTNSRLDELQAAVLRVKLRFLDQWNEARRGHATQYAEAFRGHQLQSLTGPQERPGCRHVYCLYTIRLSDRQRSHARLKEQGIETQVAYPSLVPDQPALALPHQSGAFPVARVAAREVLSLPMYPELTAAQIDCVVHALAYASSASQAVR